MHPLEKRYHEILARYFMGKPLLIDETFERPNVRKCTEQPYQQIMAGMRDELEQTLGWFPFVYCKVCAGMLKDLVKDYEHARKGDDHPGGKVERFERFLREKLHILQRGYGEWPAYKIFLQLALEYADDSPVTAGAEAYLDTGAIRYRYFRKKSRLARFHRSPCLRTIEGHTRVIGGALERPDGKIMSWSDDGTIRLWDRKGFQPQILKPFGDTTWGCRVFRLSNGNLVVWTEHEQEFLLWNTDCRPIAVMEGHHGEPWRAGHAGHNVLELSNGNILTSVYRDTELRLWDSRGNLLSVLPLVNKSYFQKELSGGRVLVHDMIDPDDDHSHAYRLWDSNGHDIGIFTMGDDFGSTVLELPNGLIIFYGAGTNHLCFFRPDGSLHSEFESRDWIRRITILSTGNLLASGHENNAYVLTPEGNLVADLRVHEKYIETAELPDGRIFSYGDEDRILRIWNGDGELLSVLENHDGFDGSTLLFLPGGNMLTKAPARRDPDRALRILDPEGKIVARYPGHTDSIIGFLVLKDGTYLSWAGDNTLKIWDPHIDASPVPASGHRDPVVTELRELSNGPSYHGHLRIFASGIGTGTC